MSFNPVLFVYEPGQDYSWQVFDHVTVAVITWNRIDLTRRFFDALAETTRAPVDVLVIDNGSTDGTVEYLRQCAGAHPGLRVIANGQNLGKPRALRQIQQALPPEGLVVLFDNDIEMLSYFWLVHVQKAFHAARLRLGHARVAFGIRMVNCEEYGFRYTQRLEVLPIPAAQNNLPRTSYAAQSKDTPGAEPGEEQVVIGWTGFLMGGVRAIPNAIFRQIRLDTLYPSGIGADDAFISAELDRLGVPFGTIENGPIARHNDWPYSDAKIALYATLTRQRTVTDGYYLWWKIRAWLRAWHR